MVGALNFQKTTLISIVCFSLRGAGKPHNEDAILLNDKVHQGRVRAYGVVKAT